MGTIRIALALLAGSFFTLGATAAPDKLLLDKSEVVLSVNISALVDSGLAKKFDARGKIQDAIKAQPQAQAILEQLHLDPAKDLHSVTVAMAGVKVSPRSAPEMPDEVLVIIRGSFDQNRIVGALTAFAAANSDKVAITDQGGTKIFEFKEKQPSSYAAFADSKTIVASNKKDTVTAALQKGSSQVSTSLAPLLGKVDDKATFWAVAGKELLKGNPQTANVEGLTLTATVRDDVKLEATVHTTNAQVAGELRQAAEGGLAFAKGLISPDAPKVFTELLDGLKLSEKGSAVCVNLDISADAVDKLIDLTKNLPGRRPGRGK